MAIEGFFIVASSEVVAFGGFSVVVEAEGLEDESERQQP